MSSLIEHKRVEFSELFYDLVFAYAISKSTALIHQLDQGGAFGIHHFRLPDDSAHPYQLLDDSDGLHQSIWEKFSL